MLPVTPQDIEIATRLLAATLLGGLIGIEREVHGKEAGFRTYSLVSLGAALAMVLSTQIYEMYPEANVDPGRIAAQVVTGIGFLGAGAIIRAPGAVKGITTAAGIWAVAGIGLACGLAQYKPAIMTTLLVLVVLMFFSHIDRFFKHRKIS